MTIYTPGTQFQTRFKFSFYGGMDDSLCGIGTPVAVPEGTPVVIAQQGRSHNAQRLLVRTVDTPSLWAWMWTDMLVTPMEGADHATL